ncbi:hypothetical protein R3P38DRAFT_2776176 [Favolaschia claudopus]|uniref:Zn(2)-C6 fungal-type domain-containing protein n=1 Tax=Favolaschia claudopus TaxID=2862362 RepID=A0AAW0BPF6_9AGAR
MPPSSPKKTVRNRAGPPPPYSSPAPQAPPSAPVSAPAPVPPPADTRMNPLLSPAGLRLAGMPASLAASDPRAPFWAPFDNKHSRAFLELEYLDPEPALEIQLKRAKKFAPILQSYREREEIPDEVEFFLWTTARLLKCLHEGLVNSKMESPKLLLDAYRAGRPVLAFRQKYNIDKGADIISPDFRLPHILKAPARAKFVADSDVEADPGASVSVVESTLPQKRRRVEVSSPPRVVPAAADPRVIEISSRGEITDALYSIPEAGAPTPALMRIPHHYVTDALNPPLYNPEALPCTECAFNFITCPGIDRSTRSSSCIRCALRKEKCSFNWTPADLMKFFEHIRPYHNVAPHSMASFLQRLYQTTVDAEYTALLHARSLSAQRLAAQDVAVAIRNSDSAMVDAAFDSMFEDSSDGNRMRRIADAYFKNVLEQAAINDTVADHPTSSVIPPPDDALPGTRGTYAPLLSTRIVPAPSFGRVDSSLAPGTLPRPLANPDFQLSSSVDFSKVGHSSAPLSQDIAAIFASAPLDKPSFGPAEVAKASDKGKRPEFEEGSSTGGMQLRRSTRHQESDSDSS